MPGRSDRAGHHRPKPAFSGADRLSDRQITARGTSAPAELTITEAAASDDVLQIRATTAVAARAPLGIGKHVPVRCLL